MDFRCVSSASGSGTVALQSFHLQARVDACGLAPLSLSEDEATRRGRQRVVIS
ncbi:hypothetical protein EXIGLDRAFT_721421, partial [Exidia glandulosa HHB12029]